MHIGRHDKWNVKMNYDAISGTLPSTQSQSAHLQRDEFLIPEIPPSLEQSAVSLVSCVAILTILCVFGLVCLVALSLKYRHVTQRWALFPHPLPERRRCVNLVLWFESDLDTWQRRATVGWVWHWCLVAFCAMLRFCPLAPVWFISCIMVLMVCFNHFEKHVIGAVIWN